LVFETDVRCHAHDARRDSFLSAALGVFAVSAATLTDTPRRMQRNWTMSTGWDRFAVALSLVSAIQCFAGTQEYGKVSLQLRGDDWLQWRGPNRDGVWNETGIPETFPASGLDKTWRVSVGRGWSSPIVAQGRVFVTDVEVAPPKATEHVLCLDEASGRQLWIHQYEAHYPPWAFEPNAGGPRATPIFCDGKVFTLGAMGHLFCLDATTGGVVWKKDLATEYQVKEFTGITASPLIDEELLILYICGKPAACVVAFDRTTGKEAWRALDDTFTYSSPIVLTAAGRKQLIVWTQEAITSLDPKTGKAWWRETLRTPGDMAVSTPVFSSPWLLIAGLMLKLDQEKPGASVVWPENKALSQRILSNTSTALLQNGYVFSSKTSGELVCLDASTGRQVWQTNSVTDSGNGSCIHLTATGDSVLLFTNQGNLISARLSAQGYHELSRVHVLEPTYPFNGRNVVWPPPAYAHGHLFARNDKELVCISLIAISPKSR
jgi:outer membrane protein assembly factor BamB